MEPQFCTDPAVKTQCGGLNMTVGISRLGMLYIYILAGLTLRGKSLQS